MSSKNSAFYRLLNPGGTVKIDFQVCPKTDIDPTKASALNVVNIGGVFVVSLGRYIINILTGLWDFKFLLFDLFFPVIVFYIFFVFHFSMQVLLCGLSFAVLVAVAEFCWRAQVRYLYLYVYLYLHLYLYLTEFSWRDLLHL